MQRWSVGILCAATALATLAPARAQVVVGNDTTLSATSAELTAEQWSAYHLGRAVNLWHFGDLPAAITALEQVETHRSSGYSESDRAAFLLAVAYLEDGNHARLLAHVEAAGDSEGSIFRQWVAFCGAANGAGATPPTKLPGAAIMVANAWLQAGRAADAFDLLSKTSADGSLTAVHLYVHARAAAASNRNAQAMWRQLADRKPTSRLEADLVAIAAIRLASASEQPDLGRLDRVPEGSRYYPRALHVRALRSLEHGDTTSAHRDLTTIARDFPDYPLRRQAALEAGAQHMNAAAWSEAYRWFAASDSSWHTDVRQLRALTTESGAGAAWTYWDQASNWTSEVRLDPTAIFADLSQSAIATRDLRRDQHPQLQPGSVGKLWPQSTTVLRVLPNHEPDADEWRTLRAAISERDVAAQELRDHQRQTTALVNEIQQKLRYYGTGKEATDSSIEALGAAAARLELLLARLDAVVAQLESTRDQALLDIAERTRTMVANLHHDVIFVRALRHFYVDGPQQYRPEKFPDGVPSPASLLSAEQALMVEAEAFVTAFAEHYPMVIARSFNDIWKPRLTGDASGLHGELLMELARARGIGVDIDSTLAWFGDDPRLRAAQRQESALLATLDSLDVMQHGLRMTIAAAVSERGLQALNREREAIDYHLADAAYEMAVAAAADTASDAELLRDRAIAHLDTMLFRHPESIARGESRFRLADLKLMKARDDFQTKMAEFLGEAPSADDLENRSLAPFVDYGPAVTLYRDILDQDHQFPHMDAVLFNLGMILSDDGQPEASSFLERMVAEHPNSPHAQEAYLRLGGDRFAQKDYAGCVAYFEAATQGSDPSLSAIALYKLGWARFEEDQFLPAADAFGDLIDLYGDHTEIAAKMDLRDEAEEYLVHSLARAGGADAFSAYFSAQSNPETEQQILMQLAHLMRSTSQFDQAVACDQLWLERYPHDEQTLEVGERLVATYRRWNKPDVARNAKKDLAPLFMPGSDWYRANKSDTLRARGLEFAQSAYREAAAHHHKLARSNGASQSWQLALENYHEYLNAWPKADDAPRMHFFAGEAAGQLNDYPVALDHFQTAARNDTGSVAIEASWQAIAVTDEWYRKIASVGTTGSDSLANLIIVSGEDFVTRHPHDKRAADIVWRQGNVAYAHQWYQQAAVSFARLAEQYAGDKRALQSSRMSGDARYQLEEFELAGQRYQQTLSLARAAQADTVITAMEKAIPVCFYKHAESIAADNEKKAAPLFARVAREWPQFPHADKALYRSGLGFAADKRSNEATQAWEALLARHPQSEFARDAAIQIATTHESAGNVVSAASAYERFSVLYPQDPDAADALLKAADLLASSGDEPAADAVRDRFLERFPERTDVAMEIRVQRAERDLANVGNGGASISALLGKGAAVGSPQTNLQAYLDLAKANPQLASPRVLAQVDYFQAEAMLPTYEAMRLTQPLEKSIEAKKAAMESLVAMYNKCTEHKISEYSRASAHRIGQALIEFGDALWESERPAELSGDDLMAYDEVLEEQTWEFYDRGEAVWSQLLRQVGDTEKDPGNWIARTQATLWPRLSQKFMYRPEMDYPLVRATPPEAPQTASK